MAFAACVVVSACSSGLPDPVMLQGALLSNNQGAATTGNIKAAQRSVASRVLTAVAVERVLGQPAQTFTLQ